MLWLPESGPAGFKLALTSYHLSVVAAATRIVTNALVYVTKVVLDMLSKEDLRPGEKMQPDTYD